MTELNRISLIFVLSALFKISSGVLTPNFDPTMSPIAIPCERYEDYACQLSNSTVVNLRPLCDLMDEQGLRHLEYTANVIPPSSYLFHPCKALQNLPSPCNGSVVSCVETELTAYPPNIVFENKGLLSTSRFFLYRETLAIQYSPISPFNETGTTVLCDCVPDKIQNPSFRYQRNKGNEVILKLLHVCCCAGLCDDGLPLPESDGLSAGSILIITFISLLAAYLIFGAIYNFRDGEHGKYLIPHLTFWEQCGRDIKLGFRLLGCNSTPGCQYENIDGVSGGQGSSPGDDIAVNYHNPDSSYSRPAYGETPTYAFQRGDGATVDANGNPILGHDDTKTSRATSERELNEEDDEYRQSNKKEQFTRDTSNYGAI